MIIAVDVGGTKTLVADFDSSGRPGKESRFETPRDEKAFLATLLETIDGHYPDRSQIDALCIALPGEITVTHRLEYAPNLGWKHIAIRTQLERAFDCPIYVENDANLAGLAEAHQLSPVPRTLLYVTVSTGIGTGVITRGHIDETLRESEGGHMLIEYDGILREWESFASGHSIYATYGKYARDITDKHIWESIADKISRGLLALIPVVRPDIVVIGGSIGTYFERYQKALTTLLSERLDKQMVPIPPVVQARYPEEAVIYGCYYYAVAQLTH